MEVEACKRLQPVTVRVNFLDSKYVMMPVNSWTTAELFAEMLCIRLGIENSKPFAVFEVSSVGEDINTTPRPAQAHAHTHARTPAQHHPIPSYTTNPDPPC